MSDWHHAPLHRLSEAGTYCVTAATRHKELFFGTPKELDMLSSTFFDVCKDSGWEPQAWSFFANHYHFVGFSGSMPLNAFINRLHSQTARELNCMQGTRGRQVWHQFWETKLTYEGSYLARLRYVHENPVHHGLTLLADEYRWCSAGWFARNAPVAFQRELANLRIDKVKVREV